MARKVGLGCALAGWIALAGCSGDPAATAPDASVDGSGPGGDDLARADAMFSATHPRIYLSDSTRRMRLTDALSSMQPTAVRFRNMVDAQQGGADYYNYQPWFSALLGQLTGNASYCDYAVQGTDASVAAEEQKISMGQAPDVAGDDYLGVGGIIGNLSRVYDWCYDTLTPMQRQRWVAYGNQAVWNVWNYDMAKWGTASFPWVGWSVDNPSNNYYYSFLEATLLFGLATLNENPDANGWITMFRQTKIQSQLVPTFNSDLVGGCSREGTGYGTAMAKLFELYDIWEASTGERIHDLTPHTHASLNHFLHLVEPTRDRIAPVGDQSRDSTAAFFDYHRNYLQILISLYRDDALASYAKWLLSHSSVPQMGQYFMYVYDFLYDEPSVVEQDIAGVYPAYYASGTGQIYFRSSWDTDATWVHLIAGPYTESHAHRDQGSLLFYRGQWLAYDQVIDSHSGIRQEEELHNLVRITQGGNTVTQSEGKSSQVVALVDTPEYGYAAVDVAPLYTGGGVTRDDRELVFLKPDTIVVFDRIQAATNTTRVWQLNAPVQPTIATTTATITGGANSLVVRRVLPAGATTTVVDWTSDGDMNGGYRIDTSHQSADGVSRFLHVMSVDGAVTSVSESSTTTLSGVSITFANGTTGKVQFNNDMIGGTLELRDAANNVVKSATLAAGVTTLPALAQ